MKTRQVALAHVHQREGMTDAALITAVRAVRDAMQDDDGEEVGHTALEGSNVW